MQVPESRYKPQIDWEGVTIHLLLIVVILSGAYFRLVGVNWDADRHLHPDERFLSMVQAAISPVNNVNDYFNTETSSLNPANRGYTFFVYGTLPIFIIRYVGEWIGQVGYDPITILGRQLSAVADLITVLLVYMIGARLYKRQVGLIAAALYAWAVLPIQLSHFMTVDTFTNTFAMLTVYAGVVIATEKAQSSKLKAERQKIEADSSKVKADSEKILAQSSKVKAESLKSKKFIGLFQDIWPYILFGIALGMATASKINAVTLSLLLPMIEGIRYFKADPDQREGLFWPMLRNMALAAVMSFIVFRICQPYAFEGPGFFNFGINETWWSGMRSLQAQNAGDVDFPPALQWARRPITFSWTNMAVWGMGLPLGITAWLSFAGMGWRIIKAKALKHLPIWAWTGFYFIWQATAWVRAMRYQVLIYPLLALIAAWGLVGLWEYRKDIKIWFVRVRPIVTRWVGIVFTALVLVGTAAWAFAFTRIYTRPHARIAATDWIYENIPGPVNLVMETEEGAFIQPLPYRSGDSLYGNQPYNVPFKANFDSLLTSLRLPQVLDQTNNPEIQTLRVSVRAVSQPDVVLATAFSTQSLQAPEGSWQGSAVDFIFSDAVALQKGQVYFLDILLEGEEGYALLNGVPELYLMGFDGAFYTQTLPKFTQTVQPQTGYTMDVTILQSGTVTSVTILHLLDFTLNPAPKTVNLTLELPAAERMHLATATLSDTFTALGDGRGEAYTFEFETPLVIKYPQQALFSLEIVEGEGMLGIASMAPVHESSWDDALPIGKEGYTPYSDNGGIFRGDLNFELYWPDEVSKRTRFETNLDQADYIFISSNRQWGTTTRVPERYPLTSAYYRNLLGCPQDKDLVWCYNLAEPGWFEGELGFELVAVFESYPTLGSLEFNSQFAEEAFSVYDHPKALIFKKTADYDPLAVRQMLRAVDLTLVQNITARQASDIKTKDGSSTPQSTLLLPETRLAEQRANGTWSELFNRESLINTNPVLAVIVFYLFILILGLLVHPLLRLALPGLDDKGYPFIRLAGMMVLAYLVWLAGSVGVPVIRLVIALILGLIAILGLVLAFLQRKTLLKDLRQNWRYYLMIEGLALLSFVFFLMIRIGNPDLWHPWKGGEKPMDFSYLNAILKSTTFPPYDPWFAGGYINYYYYGLVVVGMPIKLLGIIPSTAYNIVLPILYSTLVLGAFSIGWNLYRGIEVHKADNKAREHKRFGGAFWAGIATAILLALVSNLGTVRMIVQTLQSLGSGGLSLEGAAFGQRLNWLVQGFVMFLQKTPLPLYPGDWYWVPSRVIPGEAITEFPFFTYIYADLHAHLIALPMAVFSVAWGISILFSKAHWGLSDGKYKKLSFVLSLLLGGMLIGALKPTNTWDYYTYLTLNLVILGYASWRYFIPREELTLKPVWQRLGTVFLPILLLLFLTKILYLPFDAWYGQGYTQIGYWTGSKTPMASYLVHWGLFLFLIISWLAWESYRWMASIPMSALKKLEPHKPLIIIIGVLFLILLLGLLITKVVVALLVVPLGVWILVLLLKPDQSDGRRLVLFMLGTALTLSLAVELVYLVGDIGRMNVVFKLYMQAWVLFALSAGVCLVWLVQALPKWRLSNQVVWQLVLLFLVFSASLFPLLGTSDKIEDRMELTAPQVLDGMTYMAYATFYDMGTLMDLSEDYWAIRWMQDNIQGSPVILEGQAYEYRWGNRYTIYTGLPGVVGWNYHQRQQRAILRSNVVQERVDEVGQFYLTEDQSFVEQFLERYDVSYIVFGQLERAFFPGPGLEKFEALDGVLWNEVFRYGSTVIYEVRQ